MSYGSDHDDDHVPGAAPQPPAHAAEGDGESHESEIPVFAAQPPAWDDPAQGQSAMPWSTPMPAQPDDAQAATDGGAHQQAPYEQGAYEQQNYEQAPYEQQSYEQAAYQQAPNQQAPYEQAPYEQQNYEQAAYQQAPYEQGPYEPAPYGQPAHDQPDAGNMTMPRTSMPQEPPPNWAQPVGPPDGNHYPAPSHNPSPYPAAAPPAHVPRPEDLLVPNQSPVTSEPASWGWRGKLNRGSGGLFKTKASPAELEVRQAIAGIQRGFSRPMTVVVVQPKGGAGKTPTTICLSAAFGVYRGGYVVGWDDNETRGTLAVRVQNPDSKRATVWDLLSDLAKFETNDARVGDLSQYVRAQSSHFDALVSDDNPGNMAQIGEQEFNRLHQVLQRFYRLIVVDTGNNVRSSNWQSAVSTADLVVVVSSYQRDVGYSGSWVLDHLAQTGREELARGAITVLTAADPTTDKTVRDQLISHFTARTRAVAEIPYDQALAHGGPIVWSELDPATRNAWTKAGATIVDALVELDRQSLAAQHR